MDKYPLGLKEYDEAQGGSASAKTMYMVLAAVPAFLLVALLCFFLSLFGGGSEDASSKAGSTNELFYDAKSVASTLD